MGFFSYNCKGCGSSIKAPYGVPAHLEWQGKAVVLDYSGAAHSGEYDGYGRIIKSDGWEVEIDDSSPVWHHRCYLAADDRAKADMTPSDDARDQGYFYDDEDSGKHTVLD